MRKKITRELLVDMAERGLTLKQMCDETGYRSQSGMSKKLRDNGIDPKRPVRVWTEEEDRLLIQHYNCDTGIDGCCSLLNRSKDSIYQRVKRLGIHYRGQQHKYSKTDLVREYVDNKHTVKEVADILGGEWWHVYKALEYYGIPLTNERRAYFGKDHHKWCGYEEISQSHWGSIVKSATRRRSRAIEFNISIEEAWNLYLQQDRKCALTGLDIHFSERGANRYATTTASLDRIDSSLGYSLENCQWVHKTVNLMKMALPQDEFITFCSLVHKHNIKEV